MQCVNPDNYHPNGIYNSHIPPCGKCLSCRLSKQQEWASRLLLESKCHDSATFWTLTYSEDTCPSELSKEDMQNFIKTWRNREGSQPRYFLCGEYGSLFKRPHYHGIFFGDRPQYVWRRGQHQSGLKTLIKEDPRFAANWGKGITYVKESLSAAQTKNIMRYVAAYVVKKNLPDTDSTTQHEWALQSRKPYIGQPSVKMISDVLTTKHGSKHLAVIGTCPNFFQMAGKRFMVPLRIRREVCDTLGIEFKPYEPTEDVVEIDIDGQKTLRKKATSRRNYDEARNWQRRFENAFKRKTNRRASHATAQ